MFGYGKYYNKSLRDYSLQTINNSIRRIVIRENMENKMNALIRSEVKTHECINLTPFSYVLCIFLYLYSNKK
jgi:hypothetical protein